MIFDISLDLYKIFCTVVKTGNMSAAAKELYISQPAVSMAIRQLEDKLGKPLLHRSSKGIKVTSEGGVLFEYLSQALGLIETAEKKYMELVNLDSGEIKIGASDTILSRYLTPYIENFFSLYPNINIKITNSTSHATITLLKSGQVDIGFVNMPLAEEENSLEIFPCLQIQDCIVAGPKFAHLAKGDVQVSELCKYPLLMLESDSNSRRFVDEYAEGHGVKLNPMMELGSNDLLVQFALINFGLAFVSYEFVKEQIDNKTLFRIPLAPAISPRHIGMVTLKDVTLTYAAERFTGLFR